LFTVDAQPAAVPQPLHLMQLQAAAICNDMHQLIFGVVVGVLFGERGMCHRQCVAHMQHVVQLNARDLHIAFVADSTLAGTLTCAGMAAVDRLHGFSQHHDIHTYICGGQPMVRVSGDGHRST
jgi:hypothetical protein